MTAPRPLPSTRAHIDALTAMGADGFLVVSTPMPERKRQPRDRTPWASWTFPVDEVDQAAQACADLDAQGRNVYLRTNLLAYPLTDSGDGWSWKRGGGADTGAVTALAVDFDVVGPSHKPGPAKLPLPPDTSTAMTIVAELPAPSMTIGTGEESTPAPVRPHPDGFDLSSLAANQHQMREEGQLQGADNVTVLLDDDEAMPRVGIDLRERTQVRLG